MGSAEGRFGVDDLLAAPQRRKISSECSRILEVFEGGEELELALHKGVLEGIQKQTAE